MKYRKQKEGKNKTEYKSLNKVFNLNIYNFVDPVGFGPLSKPKSYLNALVSVRNKFRDSVRSLTDIHLF